MAKKKTTRSGPSARPEAQKPRETILSLKGSHEWSTWLDELSKKFRTTKAGMIDRALAEFAERNGFHEPPER
jgi:hypothetical protein